MSETRGATILVVLHRFGPYEKGQIISDPATVAKVIATGQARNCVMTIQPAASHTIEKAG